MLPRREHAGYVEEELQQLVMMLRHAAGRDGDGGGGGGDSDGAVASAEPEAGLLAFDFDRLRGLGGSVLSAFPMLSGQRDIDPRADAGAVMCGPREAGRGARTTVSSAPPWNLDRQPGGVYSRASSVGTRHVR